MISAKDPRKDPQLLMELILREKKRKADDVYKLTKAQAELARRVERLESDMRVIKARFSVTKRTDDEE